jgi:excisionase family DNA binding protein
MNTYTTFQDLPVILCADEVAKALRISRANAYNLMRSEGFPTLKIGKRMSVPREKLIEWIEANTAA